MFLTLVGIPIINDYSTWFLCFSTISFKSFHVKVMNLRFAPTVISLLKLRLKLGFVVHNLGNRWKMWHFFIIIKEKSRIWTDLSWLMEEIVRKRNKCNYWALHPKYTLGNISLTTDHSNYILNSLVLFSFICWELKNSRNLKKNVIKEANWVGGAITYDSPCITVTQAIRI